EVENSTWSRVDDNGQDDQRAKARALAPIIARMVAANPKDRWSDMNEVDLLIGALAAEPAANRLESIVKSAYEACRKRPEFYTRFYENFFSAAEHTRRLFTPDMSRQHQMLDSALGQLLNYHRHQLEPTTLTSFVKAHKDLELKEEDFNHFGEALIKT